MLFIWCRVGDEYYTWSFYPKDEVQLVGQNRSNRKRILWSCDLRQDLSLENKLYKGKDKIQQPSVLSLALCLVHVSQQVIAEYVNEML